MQVFCQSTAKRENPCQRKLSMAYHQKQSVKKGQMTENCQQITYKLHNIETMGKNKQ